jgi:hypothetical protein
MIHLETNLLIGAEDETDAHHLTARLALARRDFFGCSAVVWMGLHSRPAPTPLLRHARESLLTSQPSNQKFFTAKASKTRRFE